MRSESVEYSGHNRMHSPIPQMADAHQLIEAFKNIVLPIARSHAPTPHRHDIRPDPSLIGQQDINVNHSSLQPEAQQLLSALEKFITAVVVDSQSIQHDRTKDGDGAKVPTEDITIASEIHAVADASSASREVYKEELTTVKHPKMLRLALRQARDHVFNRMPIRLLAFNSDGSGIELVERHEILDRISSKMIAEFYGKYESDDGFPWNVPDTDAPRFTSAVENFSTRYAYYTILSHTWLRDTPGEVTYAHWTSGTFDVRSPGYQKLANFCRVAAMKYGNTFGWMDTICINKDSSAELDESIRSMYKWYKDATICIAYLAETTDLQCMHMDTWFTRGWTLQEMLAPGKNIKFYGANWCPISGDHEDDTQNALILDQIEFATTMTPDELTLFPWLFPISRRMQWAANRHVTRAEDAAYSLMGIFNVDMSTAYGEGSERAFIRLIKEILMSPGENMLDIINWGSGLRYEISQVTGSSLIPTSLKQYLHSADNVPWPTLCTPISLTNLGLHLPVLIMHAVKSEEAAPATPIGNYYANVTITISISHNLASPSTPAGRLVHFKILDRANPVQNSSEGLIQRFFGVLNFHEDAKNIFLPENNICFAICLYSKGGFDAGSFYRIRTSKAITFCLHQVRERNRTIRKSELAKHGMQLVTMYL